MKPNVIISHGLGNHPPDWYKPLAKELLKRVDCNIIPFYYHDIFQPFQEKHFEHYELLGNPRIRKFVFENVADGVTYNQGYIVPTIYDKVHDRLIEIIDKLDGPIVIIAPSLGGKVVMDHIWDFRNTKHMDGLKLLITNGCNIPLFVSGLPIISHLPDQKFKWLNFYDNQDVLGYPLKPLGYEVEDIRVKNKVWGIIPAWLLSHLKYWSNKKFLDRVGMEINKL